LADSSDECAEDYLEVFDCEVGVETLYEFNDELEEVDAVEDGDVFR
jgi:hypothetical protein